MNGPFISIFEMKGPFMSLFGAGEDYARVIFRRTYWRMPPLR
jgi:hypothetical protein